MAEPKAAVLFALFDPRGDPAAHLRTWTHEQTLPRERYQVVVATAAEDPAVDRELEALLSPQDVMVRAPGVAEVGLYDVAAEAATAPWVLVTEAHVLADPGCLAAVVRAVERDPDLAAVTCELHQVAHERAGRLGTRWFDEVFDSWRDRDWRELPLAGSAVRRDDYLAAGGLGERYEVFANSALAARLHARGATVRAAAGARVNHIQEGLRDHHSHSASFVRGELNYRADHEPAFCERYFGLPPEWGRRLGYRPEVARAAVRPLLAVAARPGRDAPWVLGEVARRLPAAVAGAAPYVARERLAVGALERLLDRTPLPDDRLYPWYLHAQERTERLTRLRWIRDHVGAPGPPGRRTGEWTAETLDGADLVGVHGLERHEGRPFRWTEPVALLRRAAPPGDHVLEIDTGGLRGSPLDYVRGVFAGGRPVGREAIEADDGRLRVHLPAPVAARAAATGVAVLSRPLMPRRHGSPDRRRLGMPVFSVALRAAS